MYELSFRNQIILRNNYVFTINYNVTARSIQHNETMGVISHKKGKNILKKGKIFEKLDKNYRIETKFDNFSKVQKGHL